MGLSVQLSERALLLHDPHAILIGHMVHATNMFDLILYGKGGYHMAILANCTIVLEEREAWLTGAVSVHCQPFSLAGLPPALLDKVVSARHLSNY